jgi:hypothetical protein
VPRSSASPSPHCLHPCLSPWPCAAGPAGAQRPRHLPSPRTPRRQLRRPEPAARHRLHDLPRHHLRLDRAAGSAAEGGVGRSRIYLRSASRRERWEVVARRGGSAGRRHAVGGALGRPLQGRRDLHNLVRVRVSVAEAGPVRSWEILCHICAHDLPACRGEAGLWEQRGPWRGAARLAASGPARSRGHAGRLGGLASDATRPAARGPTYGALTV